MDAIERQKLKAAKSAHKAAVKKQKQRWEHHLNRLEGYVEHRKANPAILEGVVRGEYELRDDYPVNYDYCYVVQNSAGTARVIMSEIRGTVRQLKHRDRVLDALPIVKVYNCNMAARNLLY